MKNTKRKRKLSSSLMAAILTFTMAATAAVPTVSAATYGADNALVQAEAQQEDANAADKAVNADENSAENPADNNDADNAEKVIDENNAAAEEQNGTDVETAELEGLQEVSAGEKMQGTPGTGDGGDTTDPDDKDEPEKPVPPDTYTIEAFNDESLNEDLSIKVEREGTTLTITERDTGKGGVVTQCDDEGHIILNGGGIGLKAPWYKNNNITTVKIGSGIEVVDKNAFKGCTNIKTIDLSAQNTTDPKKLTTIRENAFENTDLDSLTLSATITTIGTDAFKNSNLKKLYLPDNITASVINGGAFKTMKKESEVYFSYTEPTAGSSIKRYTLANKKSVFGDADVQFEIRAEVEGDSASSNITVRSGTGTSQKVTPIKNAADGKGTYVSSDDKIDISIGKGYTFAKWEADNDTKITAANVKDTDGFGTLNSPLTVNSTAQYKLTVSDKSYYVKLDPNGGQPPTITNSDINGKKFSIGNDITIPDNYTKPFVEKEGYSLKGWTTYKYKDEKCISKDSMHNDDVCPVELLCDYKGKIISLTPDMIQSYADDTITLYAHWQTERYGFYCVYYNLPGGTLDASHGGFWNIGVALRNPTAQATTYEDKGIIVPGIKIPIPELGITGNSDNQGKDIFYKEGYSFQGWITRYQDGDPYTDRLFKPGEIITAKEINDLHEKLKVSNSQTVWDNPAGAIRVHAAWGFNLTFDPNGGTIQKDGANTGKNNHTISYIDDFNAEIPNNIANITEDENGSTKFEYSNTVILDKEDNLTIKRPPLKEFKGWALNINPNDNEILTLDEIYGLMTPGQEIFTKEKLINLLGISESSDKNKFESLLVQDNITLYAIWETTDCKVTYDANGGEFVNTDDNNDTQKTVVLKVEKNTEGKLKHEIVTPSGITVEDSNNTEKTVDLKRNGYNFVGWSDKPDSTASSDVILDKTFDVGKELTLSDDLKLYAVWEERDECVEFRGNGGINEDNEEDSKDKYILDVKYGSKFKLPTIEETGFVRKGYVFRGWLNENDSVNRLEPGTEIDFSQENSVYLADWAPIRYHVTFDENVPEGVKVTGKKPNDIKDISYLNEETAIPESTLKRSGYIFKGWSIKEKPNLKPDNSTDDKKYDKLYTDKFDRLADSYDSEGNPITVTLYAVWEPIEYTVKFVGGYKDASANIDDLTGVENPNAMEDQTIKCDEKVKLNKNKFTKKIDGKVYDFVGWYDPTIKTDTDDDKDQTADEDNKPEAVKPVVHYTDGEDVQNLIDPEDLVENPQGDENVKTLYAVWETTSPIEIVVVSEGSLKDISGGTVKIGSTTAEAITTIDVIVNKTLGYKNISVSPADGYEFKGWYSVNAAEDGTQTIGAQLKGTDGKNAVADLSNYAYDGKTNSTIAACFAKKQYGIGLRVENGGTIKMSDKAFKADGTTDGDSSRTVSFDKEGASGSYGLKHGESAADAFVYIAAPGTGNYDKSITISKNGTAFKSYNNDQVAELLKNGPFTGSMADLLGVSGDTEIGAEDNYQITISFKLIIQKFKVTASAGSNGTITPAGVTESESGKPIKVEAKANDGYYVSKVTINGTAQTLTSFDTTWSREFASDTTIEVEFAEMPPSVKVTSIDPINGKLTLSKSGSVPVGSRITATASPDSGYRVKGIYVNGERVSTATSYTFEVRGDTTVEVAFEEGRGTSSSDRVFVITGTTDGNGTLSIGSEAEVEHGDDLTVEIKSKVGYAVDRVTVDGKRTSSTYSYTFRNVRDNHTINVTFKRDNRTYKVTGKSGTGGNLSIDTEELLAGEDLTVRITPYANYRISDVKVDGKSVGRVNSYKFESVHEDHTIEAVFGESSYNQGQYGVSNDDGIVNVTGSTFIDVPASSWYFPAVKYVCERSLVSSTSMNTFSPNTNASRAVIISMMYNNQGRPSVSSGSKYSDVGASSWYGDAVAWGTQSGIVNGVSNTMFKPNGEVTREQLAAMFYRYAQYRGVNVTNTVNTKVMSYSDAGKVSPYAMDALSWACNMGLLNGKSNTILDPQGTATRAEISAIMMRFCQNYL